MSIQLIYQHLRRLGCAAVLLFSFGCSGSFKHSLTFNPGESIRVAVLPFAQVDEKGEFIEETGALLVDGIPLVTSEASDAPPAIVRKLVYVELSRTALDVISPQLIDLELPHRGFAYPDGRFDLKKIHKVSPRVFCDQFLDCDAVLYGRITEWDRSYYGLESAHRISVELKLVSANSGKVLFESSASDYESRGLSKGPTGYSSLVVEPLRGLDADIIEDLARRMVQQMLTPLRPDAQLTPLASPPALFAVSHDASDGVITGRQPLVVLAFGSEGMLASFSIGEHVKQLPMLEQSPGHYIGEYWPLEDETFAEQTVEVRLQDQFGRVTTVPVDLAPVTLLAQ